MMRHCIRKWRRIPLASLGVLLAAPLLATLVPGTFLAKLYQSFAILVPGTIRLDDKSVVAA